MKLIRNLAGGLLLSVILPCAVPAGITAKVAIKGTA
jgi:hypothetical protein